MKYSVMKYQFLIINPLRKARVSYKSSNNLRFILVDDGYIVCRTGTNDRLLGDWAFMITEQSTHLEYK